MLRQFFGAAALATMMVVAPALAAEIKPAVVYDLGGKNDQSFNQSAYNGAEAYQKDTGTDYRDFEIQNDAQREQALRRFAQRGYDPIVAIGFSQAEALKKVAPEFPDTKFAIVDMVVDLPNVRSIVFKEHEGSFLVGLLAAKASQTGKVGFVGGMDIPLIRAFACGYKQGAKAANPDIEIFENMIGTTGAAWNDPVKGGELTKSQIDRGADVIYHAAGGSGAGVLQAAADAGKLGIGVDSNQNALHPGNVLTSMVKRVDTAVYNAFKDLASDDWSSGIYVLGLAEDGVAWADDENNKDLITDDMRAAVDQASKEIIDGKIVVHDYRADNSCPF
ncbi:nucleoside-binding protein [Cohaesibacter marisflavi]|uniref:Nucleoside-binding protein n=1 Tax=Cohaesibacter marisflavi TaxID=655353 RepID=A0A1I5CXY8_9HYPH|nr:BMP family ABC transporter substrate-binding protein [Cohaesibacter marisflavi]SFN91808.1 nucleoside-binding protein [Cohaesibacter marisflavi]